MGRGRPKELVARGMTAYRKRALERVRDIVLDGLAGYDAAAYLFGSCARGDALRSSDIDVAVDAAVALPIGLLSRISEELEESTIPYEVEVVDLREVSASMRARVLKEGIEWMARPNA